MSGTFSSNLLQRYPPRNWPTAAPGTAMNPVQGSQIYGIDRDRNKSIALIKIIIKKRKTS